MAVILQGVGVSKAFGGLMAVQDVNFEVQEGEIFGLIGPNGSGKTTLLNLISGVFPLTHGQITFQGHRIDRLQPHQITRLGIGRAFQVVRTFEGLSVAENILVGRLFGSSEGKEVRKGLREVEEILEFVKLSPKKDSRTSEITIADKKRMELARALAMNPRLVLLDEVMAGLNPREVDDLMEMVLAVNRRGITVLMIEHVMKAVMGISTRLMVLHHGRRIAMGAPKEIVENEEVIKSYLGERFSQKKSC
jgi:branched-chain amino acid transport system ATP-binding protein